MHDKFEVKRFAVYHKSQLHIWFKAIYFDFTDKTIQFSGEFPSTANAYLTQT